MPLLSNSVKAAYESRTTSSSGGKYLNPGEITEGDKVRITFLGDDSVAGWELWATGNGGKRMPIRFADQPTDAEIVARLEELGATRDPDSSPRPFFGFAIWNYNTSKVQVFQFGQMSLSKPLIEALSDEEVEAEPQSFDFTVTATGTGRDKRYSVVPLPGKRRQPAVDKEITAAWTEAQSNGFNLGALLNGGDPFGGSI